MLHHGPTHFFLPISSVCRRCECFLQNAQLYRVSVINTSAPQGRSASWATSVCTWRCMSRHTGSMVSLMSQPLRPLKFWKMTKAKQRQPLGLESNGDATRNQTQPEPEMSSSCTRSRIRASSRMSAASQKICARCKAAESSMQRMLDGGKPRHDKDV